MSNALEEDLGWFWYYWLWTTDSVDGSLKEVSTVGTDIRIVVRQDGQMPSPIVLKVKFEEEGPLIPSMPNAMMISENSAIVSWPVDIWFDGSREIELALSFGDRVVTKITLDPDGRFPDSNPDDNVWEK